MRLAPLVFVAALAAACDVRVGNGNFDVGIVTGRAQDEWTRAYDLKPGAKIQIVNINGKVAVQPNEGSRVDVRAERIVKARSDEGAKAILDRLDILETVSAEGVRLQTKPRERLSMGQNQEVRYHLKVPAGIAIDIQTTNGLVELINLDAGIVAATTNGNVVARNLSGSLEASTTNGRVVLDLTSIREGGVKVETVNGGVQLRVPYEMKADILARCVNGGISVDNLKLDTTAERSRRRLEATMNGGGPKIDIETTNGSIRIASWRSERYAAETSR